MSLLVERALSRHGGTRHLENPDERRALDELTKLLGGYPLPLTVVLPALADTPPSRVLADLSAGGDTPDPSRAIQRAIEYSHGCLDPAAQQALQLLAPFTAVIPVVALNAYQDLLKEHGLDRDVDLAAAVEQATAAGLASPHSVLRSLVQVQPVLPYFLRVRIHEQAQLASIVNKAHRDLYINLGSEIWQLLTSTDPNQRVLGQAVAQAEYANLTTALHHAIATNTPLKWLVRSIEEYLDQTQQHDTRRRILEETITSVEATSGTGHDDELQRLHNLAGHTALAQHRLIDAHTHYTQELHIHERANNRRAAAVTYHQLGMVAQEQRRFEEAEGHYQQALTIKLEFNNRHSAADTYGQLGNMAQEQRWFEEAEGHYRQALTIYLEFNNRHSAAIVYHNLGNTVQEQRRFEEAEGHYQQALNIKLEFNNRHSAAMTYSQLGILLTHVDRVDEAVENSLQALAIRLDTTRSWSPIDLVWLKRQRRLLGLARFDELVKIHAPTELAKDLPGYLEDVDDPNDPPDPDHPETDSSQRT